jgi:hypothetical protein
VGFRAGGLGDGPGRGGTLPGEERFDIVAVAEALREAGTMVLYGVSGVLDDYSAYQADMRRSVVGPGWRAFPGRVRQAGWLW